ncbi:MAG: hypothetical protein WCZ02_08745, partial [Lysobacterales bacterium]
GPGPMRTAFGQGALPGAVEQVLGEAGFGVNPSGIQGQGCGGEGEQGGGKVSWLAQPARRCPGRRGVWRCWCGTGRRRG